MCESERVYHNIYAPIAEFKPSTDSFISSFSGRYSFLSNFYEHPMEFRGMKFRNSEAAFQACKCWGRADEFSKLSAKDAKKLGRKVQIRSDWELVKYDCMLDILRVKFSDRVLSKLLLDTGDYLLIEGNYWKDRFWGVCEGYGANRLGTALMAVRDELRAGNQDYVTNVPKFVRNQDLWLIDWSVLFAPNLCYHLGSPVAVLFNGRNGSAYCPYNGFEMASLPFGDSMDVTGRGTRYCTEEEYVDGDLYPKFDFRSKEILDGILKTLRG